MNALDELNARLRAAEPAFAVKGNEGRRQLMNYTGPQRRTDNCRGCKFMGEVLLNTGSLAESSVLKCKVGEFSVAGGGVCEHWARAK